MPSNDSFQEILDKEHENKSIKELVRSSPAVLQGLTDEKAQLLKEALGVKTIKDLATNKYIIWAQALTNLSPFEKK